MPRDVSDMTPRPHVAIAIATFRRPEGLKRLLESLDGLAFRKLPPPQITIVVVDNDAGSSWARDSAELRAWSRHTLIYRVEPQRGLAAVRNACLGAVPKDCDAVAFLDDDEWVEPQWLEALLAKRQTTGAPIIQGPVRPVFAEPPAPWLLRAPYHEVGPFVDGQQLSFGATGNCLLDVALLRATGILFDQRFNVSGGEDTDFFHRLLKTGATIVAARDAVAFEMVPRERMTRRWVLKRQMRVGHTLGVVARKHGEGRRRALKGALRLAQGAFVALLGAPMAVVGRDGMAMRGLSNMAWGYGTLSSYLGTTVDQYS